MKINKLETLHGDILFPAFMPDATYGTVKGMSFGDLKTTGIKELVTTTLHIEQTLTSEYIEKYGGLHKFFNWNRPILTDSGGFQVFSLIHRTKNKDNVITDAGCSFTDYKTGKHSLLTPEISQIIQHRLGSDIRVVLDEPVVHDGALSQAKTAVKRTTDWAKRAKKKFLELNNLSEADFNNPQIKRPLLTAVIQGGNNFDLRRQSAEELLQIGFDIYGFGGLPLHNTFSWKNDAPTGFHHELLEFVSNLVPNDKLKYGLGIGSPDDIEYCAQLGWHLFDTVLPTRNGRHGYLYVSPGQGDQPEKSEITKSGASRYSNYEVLHVRATRHAFDENPVDANCDCECCRTVSRAYLRHLLRIGDGAGYRLASIHNLTFYSKLMNKLQI